MSMLASFVGSIIASVYSSRSIKGYHLPLLSNATTFTRYTVVIGAAIKMHLSRQITENKILPCLKVYSGENTQRKKFDLELKPLDFIICSMVLSKLSGDFKIDPVFFSIFQKDKSTLRSVNGLIKSIALIKEHNSTIDILTELEDYFPNINNIDLERERVDLKDASLNQVIEMAIHIGIVSVDFDDTMRRCLYVGGDFDALMIISATIAELSGKAISPELKLFSKKYLQLNTPELYNLAFSAI